MIRQRLPPDDRDRALVSALHAREILAVGLPRSHLALRGRLRSEHVRLDGAEPANLVGPLVTHRCLRDHEPGILTSEHPDQHHTSLAASHRGYQESAIARLMQQIRQRPLLEVAQPRPEVVAVDLRTQFGEAREPRLQVGGLNLTRRDRARLRRDSTRPDPEPRTHRDHELAGVGRARDDAVLPALDARNLAQDLLLFETRRTCGANHQPPVEDEAHGVTLAPGK